MVGVSENWELVSGGIEVSVSVPSFDDGADEDDDVDVEVEVDGHGGHDGQGGHVDVDVDGAGVGVGDGLTWELHLPIRAKHMRIMEIKVWLLSFILLLELQAKTREQWIIYWKCVVVKKI